jgi:hypothetical protein
MILLPGDVFIGSLSRLKIKSIDLSAGSVKYYYLGLDSDRNYDWVSNTMRRAWKREGRTRDHSTGQVPANR